MPPRALAMKALELGTGAELAGVQDLEGDDPIERGVAGAPDGAERALADAFQELELGRAAARCLGGHGVGNAERAAAVGALQPVGRLGIENDEVG